MYVVLILSLTVYTLIITFAGLGWTLFHDHLTRSIDCDGALINVQGLDCHRMKKFLLVFGVFFLWPNCRIFSLLVICKTDTWVGKVFWWARDSIVPPKYLSPYALLKCSNGGQPTYITEPIYYHTPSIRSGDADMLQMWLHINYMNFLTARLCLHDDE